MMASNPSLRKGTYGNKKSSKNSISCPHTYPSISKGTIMANTCCFELRAKGNKLDLWNLHADMADKTKTPNMPRVNTALLHTVTENADGTATAYIYGDCDWSSLASMTDVFGRINENVITLEDEAKNRNLEIEVHDWKPEMEFATKIRVKPDGTIKVNEYDYLEVYWNPMYGSLTRYINNLTDEDKSAVQPYLDRAIDKFPTASDDMLWHYITGGEKSLVICDLDFDKWDI